MTRETWKITFYRADEDPNTSAYSSILASTLSGYSGYGTTTAYIVAPENKEEWNAATTTDVSGWEEVRVTVRDVFSVELYPFRYDDNATLPDLTDWATLRAWLTAKDYLWASITAGTRTYPAATYAMPINIGNVSHNINRSAGTHSVTLELRVKGLA